MKIWIAVTGIFLILSVPQFGIADGAGDLKRAKLAKVKRIVIVPPFFSTTVLRPVEPEEENEKPDKERKKQTPKAESKLTEEQQRSRQKYREYLTKIEERLAKYLPERVAARTPFTLISQQELADALRELKLKPQRLFQNYGRMRGSRFALPDEKNIRLLCAHLKADAILVGTLDEPRRINQRSFVDTLFTEVDTSHVRGKAGYFVLLANGEEVLHAYIEVLRPVTRVGSRDFILQDWIEVEEQTVIDLLVEWTRYTPPG